MNIIKIDIPSSAPCNQSNIVINNNQILNSIYKFQTSRGNIIHHFTFTLNLTALIQSEIDCLLKRTINGGIFCNVTLSDGTYYSNGILGFNGLNYWLSIY